MILAPVTLALPDQPLGAVSFWPNSISTATGGFSNDDFAAHSSTRSLPSVFFWPARPARIASPTASAARIARRGFMLPLLAVSFHLCAVTSAPFGENGSQIEGRSEGRKAHYGGLCAFKMLINIVNIMPHHGSFDLTCS